MRINFTNTNLLPKVYRLTLHLSTVSTYILPKNPNNFETSAAFFATACPRTV